MNAIGKLDRPAPGGNRRMEWVSDVAAEMLRRLGVKYVSLNPGASYRGFHDSIVNYLGNEDPQMLLCLHEDHAISIAHGYAKVAGAPMGAIVHSNVGLMHGLMGMFNAWCDRAPVLVMGATGPVDAPLRRPWIDWIHTAKDQGMMLRNFVKWDDEPRSAEALVETMLRAAILARTPPRGPAYVCLDAGLQETRLAAEVAIPDPARFEVPDPPSASSEAVGAAADALLAADRPVILMGRTSRRQEDWDRRVRLAEMLGARVVTDLKNAAAFPTGHPLHAGPPANWVRGDGAALVREADALLVLDWVDLAGVFKALGAGSGVAGTIVDVTLDSYVHNGWSMDHFGLAAADLRILADPDAFAAQLLDEAGRRLGGRPRFAGGRAAPAAAPEAKDPSAAIAPRDLAYALGAVKGGRRLTLTRVPLGWDGAAYRFDGPLDYLGNDGGGGLGSGAGNAIGAALALQGTGRLAVAVLGDGDFMQGGSALWTAAHYRIPVLFVVSNNRSNFNDEVHQEAMAKERGRPVENRWIGQRIDDPALDLAGYARAQGVSAAGPVETVGALAPALEAALAQVEAGAPYLLDVIVQPGYSAPMVTRASGEASTGTAS